MARWARGLAVVAVVAWLVAGCDSGGAAQDELQAVDNPKAAKPARSPAAKNPDGSVFGLPGNASSVLADPRSRTLAVALDKPTSVLLYPLDRLDARPRTVPLPGRAESLNLAGPGGPVLASVGSAHKVVRIDLPNGQASQVPVGGTATFATRQGSRTLVALRDRRGVQVLDGARPLRTISGGLYSADQVFALGSWALVLDRLRNALFELDVPGGEVGNGQRTGDGAGHATLDRYGRVLVTDTRGDSLLAFSTDPLLMRQRYPVPGSPYGIAYDQRRDLAWITLTARNEVVGFDVAGGEPKERYRFSTLRQPNAVTVDTLTGRVIVVSATGDGIQVVQP
ncbi:MAG: hypothetical protein GEU98_17385 [Pseudonocardiaceae bacterium]|nr:hypothetical protein [Pseudonocardiaceae bacterium]